MKSGGILNKLGLSSNEAITYTSLIELGPSTVADIAKKTGLHRPTIYQVLPKLLERDLISTTSKGKRRLYVAESPEKLRALSKNLQQELESFIPHLKSIYSSREKKPLVKFLEGRKGITSILDDVVETLPHGSTFYRYGAIRTAERTDKYLPPQYRERRDKKQLERLVITNESIAREKKKRLEREIKILPTTDGLFDYDVTEIMYGDKVAFIDYNSETVLLIENPKIAEFQKALFKSLYKRL
jgi:sugar-specific transcriptional regulator TrmB